MPRSISEADWKIFRELRSVALERYCERVFAEVAALTTDKRWSNHERYQALCSLIQKRDEEIEDGFDCLRRSTALRQLAFFQSLKLLTETEMARFSPDTREAVRIWLS